MCGCSPWSLGAHPYLSTCFRPFALNDLDDYEKHFTVMNYDPDVALKQVGSAGAQEQVGSPVTVLSCVLSGSLFLVLTSTQC